MALQCVVYFRFCGLPADLSTPPRDAVQKIHIVRIHGSGGQRTKPPKAESFESFSHLNKAHTLLSVCQQHLNMTPAVSKKRYYTGGACAIAALTFRGSVGIELKKRSHSTTRAAVQGSYTSQFSGLSGGKCAPPSSRAVFTAREHGYHF